MTFSMFSDLESEATFASASEDPNKDSYRELEKTVSTHDLCQRIEQYFYNSSRSIVREFRSLLSHMLEEPFDNRTVDSFISDLRTILEQEIHISPGRRIHTAFSSASLEPPRPIFIDTFARARKFCDNDVSDATLRLITLRGEVVSLKTRLRQTAELRAPVILELSQLQALRKATDRNWRIALAQKHDIDSKRHDTTEQLEAQKKLSKEVAAQIELVTKQRAALAKENIASPPHTEIFDDFEELLHRFKSRNFSTTLRDERARVASLRNEFQNTIQLPRQEPSASRTEVHSVNIQSSRIRREPSPRTRRTRRPKQTNASFKNLLASVTLEQEEGLANAVSFLSDVKSGERDVSIRNTRRRDVSLCSPNPYPLFHY